MNDLPTSDLISDYDWAAVLHGGDAYSGAFEARPGGNGPRCPDITADDIANVEAWDAVSSDGYASVDLVALVRLTNGRWAAVTAWCDTTGWDCRSDAQWRVADSRPDVIRYGLDNSGRTALGLVIDQ